MAADLERRAGEIRRRVLSHRGALVDGYLPSVPFFLGLLGFVGSDKPTLPLCWQSSKLAIQPLFQLNRSYRVCERLYITSVLDPQDPEEHLNPQVIARDPIGMGGTYAWYELVL